MSTHPGAQDPGAPSPDGAAAVAPAEAPSVAQVKAELDALQDEARSLTPAAIKDGTWFTRFLVSILETQVQRVNADYFKAKYPHLPADAVAARRIALAQTYAAIQGGLSAAAYSAFVVATVGTKGAASAFTLPAGLTAFAVDLLYTSRLQLQLAHDLAVLYRAPIDLDDPEDLADLFMVAFGVKAGELFRGGLARLAPEAARSAVRAGIHTSRLAWLQAVPVVGKHLVRRNLVKVAIPVAAIPISAAFNHYATGAIGRMARQVYRDKAAAHETARRLRPEIGDDALLLLKLVFVAANVDGELEAEEAWLLHAFTHELSEAGDEAALDAFRGLVNIDRAEVLTEVSRRPAEVRSLLFEAAAEAVAADHQLRDPELAFLRELAARCDGELDESWLLRLVAKGAVGR
jgi:hypothetical protein